jgi:hypothetical protein
MRRAILLTALVLPLMAAPSSTAAGTAIDTARNRAIICQVFGPYCQQAIAVTKCESGWSHWARNGQYLGLFQMGSYARGLYGHAWNPWAQARAAWRYFAASGKDWSPWSCKPW